MCYCTAIDSTLAYCRHHRAFNSSDHDFHSALLFAMPAQHLEGQHATYVATCGGPSLDVLDASNVVLMCHLWLPQLSFLLVEIYKVVRCKLSLFVHVAGMHAKCALTRDNVNKYPPRRSCCHSVHAAGDKESFWMAFELASIPYMFCGDYASGIGHVHIDAQGEAELCPMHLLHLDHSGKPFWWNGSLYAFKGEQKRARLWLQPSSWAASTGVYDILCMREIKTRTQCMLCQKTAMTSCMMI